MANEEQLAILRQGVEVWNEWRKKNSVAVIDLSEADLKGQNLIQGMGNGADLSGVNLSGADLSWTDLSLVNLNEANLCGANLTSAILVGTLLTGAELGGAKVGCTSFDNVDLSQVSGLETVTHETASSVGIDTIYRSQDNIPEVFLRGCGVPENLITYMRSLTAKAFDFYSCFISHSAKDKRFCERLYADLQAKSVRVWYFPEDAKWGEPVWGEIDRSIKIYDKLIVVCSENSLVSGPVNREIERALNREDKEGKGILFPIRIDEYIFEKWEHERKADVVRKVVGDFSGWDKDAAKYDKAFDKLLKGLQAESGKL